MISKQITFPNIIMFLLISIPIKISFVNRVERERQRKKKESTSLSISGVTHAHVVGRRGRWAHTHLFEFPAYLSVWAARRGSPFKGTCLPSPLISRFKGNQFIIRHLFIITLIDLGKNVQRRQNTGFRFAFTIYMAPVLRSIGYISNAYIWVLVIARAFLNGLYCCAKREKKRDDKPRPEAVVVICVMYHRLLHCLCRVFATLVSCDLTSHFQWFECETIF